MISSLKKITKSLGFDHTPTLSLISLLLKMEVISACSIKTPCNKLQALSRCYTPGQIQPTGFNNENTGFVQLSCYILVFNSCYTYSNFSCDVLTSFNEQCQKYFTCCYVQFEGKKESILERWINTWRYASQDSRSSGCHTSTLMTAISVTDRFVLTLFSWGIKLVKLKDLQTSLVKISERVGKDGILLLHRNKKN